MSDRRFITILIIVLVAITTIPFAYGYLTRPTGAIFTGIHQLTPGDTATYYAFMEQSAQGDWLFTNLYTTEDQERILFSPLWLMLGKIKAMTHASSVLLYQLARIGLIPFFLWSVFRLVRFVVHDKKIQRVSMLFVSFASGLGLFFHPFFFDRADIYNSPVDAWVPEAIPFLSMFHSPLLLLSWSLLILSLYYVLRFCFEPRLTYGIYAGLLSACLFLIHPFYVPTIWAVGGIWVLIRIFLKHKDSIKTILSYAIMICLSAPVLFYFYWISRTSAVLKMWSSGNILESPDPVMYVIGFGLLLPLAIIGAYRMFTDERLRYMSIWLIVGAALLYAPLDFQRRLVEGLFIPIAILAAVAAVALHNTLKSRFAYGAMFFVMFLSIFLPITNVKVLFQDFVNFSQEKTYPHYIPAGDAQAMQWIKNNTQKDAKIISAAFYSGNMIPAFTGRYVFVGHGPQTLFLDEKLGISEQWYGNGMTNDERERILSQYDIDYIFWGKTEKAIGSFNPHLLDFVLPVFTSENTTVFQVVQHLAAY